MTYILICAEIPTVILVIWALRFERNWQRRFGDYPGA